MTVQTSLTALRPVNAVHHLARAPAACPLSLRDVLRGLPSGAPLPVVLAPLPVVARGALVAAKEAGAVIGLALGPQATPEAWFEAVASAADEVAPRLPFFVMGELRVEESAAAVERAFVAAHRLIDAGVTHLSVDVAPVARAQRAQVASRVAGIAAERELAVDCLLPLGVGLPLESADEWLDEFEGWGVRADLVSVRCKAAADAREAKDQLATMKSLSAVLGGRPIFRRGPLSKPLNAEVRASGLRLCEDGGAALGAARRAIAAERSGGEGEGGRAALALPPEEAERLEALAYGEVAELLEAFGAAGTAVALASALGPSANPKKGRGT